MMRIVKYYGEWEEVEVGTVDEAEYEMMLNDERIIEVLAELDWARKAHSRKKEKN